MKKLVLTVSILSITAFLYAQNADCVFKPAVVKIDFGSGMIPDINSGSLYNYRRVGSYCPTDGHYSFTPFTGDCFRGDWQTIAEDHTPGDADGNMLIVNASPEPGTFLTTTIEGLKGGTIYEFSLWLMNVCRITEKCPYPLLPNLTIKLQSPDGKIVAQFGTGELARVEAPQWKQYKAVFTTSASPTTLVLTMINNAPGGCGNDFAVDDLSFRECILQPPVVSKPAKPSNETKKPATPVVKKITPEPVKKPVAPPATTKVIPEPVKKQPPVAVTKKPVPEIVKKQPANPGPQKVVSEPEKRQPQSSQPVTPASQPPPETTAVVKIVRPMLPAPPPILRSRSNPLIKQIELPAGDITLDLYDNGEIDGDTVSVYHNNVMLVSNARISEKALSFRITLDAAHPHHEIIMVAENLGSIPPNTSLMVVKSGTKRYEVFISSNQQKNAKIVFDLKE